MRKYEKIDTIYSRDTEGSKNLRPGVFRDSTVEYLALNKWIWTEKIDGTNIRIHWDGHQITFGGRTDNAQIPSDLVTKLNEIFMNEAAEELFEQTFGEKEVIIFGEGTLYEATKFVCDHPNSVVAEDEVEMEGIVARPEVEMRDRCGNRIIVKIKWCDMKELI